MWGSGRDFDPSSSQSSRLNCIVEMKCFAWAKCWTLTLLSVKSSGDIQTNIFLIQRHLELVWFNKIFFTPLMLCVLYFVFHISFSVLCVLCFVFCIYTWGGCRTTICQNLFALFSSKVHCGLNNLSPPRTRVHKGISGYIWSTRYIQHNDWMNIIIDILQWDLIFI